MSFVKTIYKAIRACDDKYTSRKEIAIKLYNEGKIKQDVFGQLATHNFSDEIIQTGIKRGWFKKDIEKQLMLAGVNSNITRSLYA